MKYFTDEVLKHNCRNTDGTIPEILSKASHDASEYYNAVVKLSLPNDFIFEYEKNRGFHDFCIKNIFIKKTKDKHSHLYLNIELADLKYCIVYDDVVSFYLCENDNGLEFSKYFGLWNIDEFEILDNGIINHEILLMFGDDHRIKISCKKVHISHIHQK